MPQWEGKSKGTPLGYRIFVFLCKQWGAQPAYLLLRFVAAYYFLFSLDSSRHIYSYFRLRLGYGRLRSLRMIYRNYYIFGQTLIDKVMVMAGIGNQFTYDFDGEENLRDIVKQGKGGILLSGHLGNWEAAGHLLNRLNTRVNVLMYDGEHEKIKKYLTEVTGGTNFNVIVIRKDLSHVYAMGEALQKNELICIHADRFTEGAKTIAKSFLGADAHFPVGPFMLGWTFHVPISIVFAFKESGSHYHFYGSKLINLREMADREMATEYALRSFVDNLEHMVRKYPEQWFNYYNFWSEVPHS